MQCKCGKLFLSRVTLKRPNQPIVQCVGHTTHNFGHTMHYVDPTIDELHEIFLKVLTIFRVKNNFSKTVKNCLKIILILFFFQILDIQEGGLVGSDQIWKISDFFSLTLMNPTTKLTGISLSDMQKWSRSFIVISALLSVCHHNKHEYESIFTIR